MQIMENQEPSTEDAETGSFGNSEASPPGPPCISPEQEEREKACAELNDRFLRLAADFENFRKRTERDQERITALANERFAADVLEVVDNLDRALKADESHLREGVMQIQQLLNTKLSRQGIVSIDSLHKPFNPEEHEAVVHVLSDKEPGLVIDEISRGYRMQGKVIRYAKVAVSKNKEENSEA